MSSQTTVKLLSCTSYPVETVYAEWVQSRSNDTVLTAEQYHEKAVLDSTLRDEIRKTFEDVIKMGFPISDSIYFTFLLEDMPISLREQIVRHKIGHRFGARLGVDGIPDIASSSYWSQTMRIINMSNFASCGRYIIPDTVGESPEALARYNTLMKQIGKCYKELIGLGIPPEDARQIIPLGATHRMTWTLSLSALMSLLKKRTCWIAQLGIWKPVIVGMVKELSENVSPLFKSFIVPPCIKADVFSECPYKKENEGRVDPNNPDPGPPCSLWIHNHFDTDEVPQDPMMNDRNRRDLEKVANGTPEKLEVFDRMRGEFSELWGRNPETGKRFR